VHGERRGLRQQALAVGVAIDGKSVPGGAALWLTSVTDHIALVLIQRQIPDKASEISELSKLVASWT
jgi:hypothetical protein